MSSAVRWGVIVGLVAIATFVVWLFQVPNGVALVLGIALVGFLAWYFLTQVLVIVEELEAGVVFNRARGRFKRFLRPGWHLIVPVLEYAQKMDLSFQAESGTTKGARTSEGLPVTLEWWLSYQLKPFELADAMKPSMARTLLGHAGNMVKNHGINCLQLVVEQYSVDDLCRKGMQHQIEEDFKKKVAERLQVFGIEVGRAMVHSIELPPQVVDAMNTAHEREVEALTLRRLYDLVKDFDDNYMTRLAELERMRLLGKNGVSLVYPMSAVVEGKQPSAGTQTGVPAPRPIVRSQPPSEPKS